MYDMNYAAAPTNPPYYDQQPNQDGNELTYAYQVQSTPTTSELQYSTGYQQMNYSQPSPGMYQQWNNNQQQYHCDQRGLGSYVSGYQQDYPDINSLEPSLIPNGSDYTPYSMSANGMVNQVAYHHHNSPTGSSHTSTGSEESTDDFYASWHPYKRSPPGAEFDARPKRGKQAKKRKPKRDPNEPQKPVSAYALFFRDTQAAIKGTNPNASFGEVSKIVASMWDNLETDAKNNYKQKTETAKKDYLKQLAAYRANLISKNGGSGGLDGMIQQQDVSSGGQLNHIQTSPDSTTVVSSDGSRDSSLSCSVGEKSLASLIAEPTPHQVLTATTTLTVPQSYARNVKPEFEHELHDFQASEESRRQASTFERTESQPWKQDFCPNEGLVQHCRDVFSIWGQPRQPQHASVQQPNYAHV